MHLLPGERVAMAQKITIKLAEREYVLKADTEEKEEIIRMAATVINKRLSDFSASFPGKSAQDLISFVAINECVGRLSMQRRLEAVQAEADKLLDDTLSYLGNIEKK